MLSWKAVFVRTLLPITILLTTGLSGLADSVNLASSSYLRHNGWGSIREVAFDSEGNLLVLLYGDLKSSDYAALCPDIRIYRPPGADETASDDKRNLMVLKLNPEASKVIWATIVEGQDGPFGGNKGAYGIVVRKDNIYVAGTTYHDLFPTTGLAWDKTYNDLPSDKRSKHGDGFFLVLSAEGALVYSTYFGGRGWDTIRGGLEVDEQGSVYLVGSTNSPEFLEDVRTLGNQNRFARGFVIRLSEKRSAPDDGTPDEFNVDYVYYLGGDGETHEETVTGIMVGPRGLLHIGQLGWGEGASLTSNAWQVDSSGNPAYGGGASDFLFTVLNPEPDPLSPKLHYASYLGGPDFDGPEHRIVVDMEGSTYLCGGTVGGFPTLEANQPLYGGDHDGVLAKFDSSGQLVFSTYIGVEGTESMFGPAIDLHGNVWIAGFAQSPTFSKLTTSNALDWNQGKGAEGVKKGRTYQGGKRDIVIQQYTPSGKLLFSSLFGGGGFDYGRFVAVAPNGEIVVVGETDSSDFPTKRALFSSKSEAGNDSFLIRLSQSKGPAAKP